MPLKIREMALARRDGATRSAAVTAATPKNAPWASDTSTRADISKPYPGATPARRLPTTKTAMRSTRTARRGKRVVKAASGSAPATTPRA